MPHVRNTLAEYRFRRHRDKSNGINALLFAGSLH